MDKQFSFSFMKTCGYSLIAPQQDASNGYYNLIFLWKKNNSTVYSKTCVRQPPLKLTLVVDVERWLSYKGTCHVILLAKLHDMYFYKTDNFFHINRYLKSVLKVAVLHRFYCSCKFSLFGAMDYLQHIRKTCLYKFDPLKPHFYIVKLGFTGVYISFLIYAKDIDCGYLLELSC